MGGHGHQAAYAHIALQEVDFSGQCHATVGHQLVKPDTGGQRSIDSRVAHGMHGRPVNALTRQIGCGPGGGREMPARQARGELAVFFLGKRLTRHEGAQARLHMPHRHIEVIRGLR
jgi:hypothetical protein